MDRIKVKRGLCKKHVTDKREHLVGKSRRLAIIGERLGRHLRRFYDLRATLHLGKSPLQGRV